MRDQIWTIGGRSQSVIKSFTKPPIHNYVIIIVKVLDASKSVRILGSGFNRSQIDKIFIDNEESEIISDTLMFSSIGDHRIDICMKPSLTSLYHLFAYCDRIVRCDFTNLDTSKVTTMNRMCFRMYNLEELCVDNLNTDNVTDMMCAFAYLYLIKSIDLRHINTSKVTNFLGMFLKDYALEEVKGCENLVSISATNLSAMFNVTKLKDIDTSEWDTSNVTTADNLCASTQIQSFNGIHLDLSKATNYNYMFEYCPNLTEVKLGKINPEATVTNMFNVVGANGTLYYDSRYDFSKIMSVLPSTWRVIKL